MKRTVKLLDLGISPSDASAQRYRVRLAAAVAWLVLGVSIALVATSAAVHPDQIPLHLIRIVLASATLLLNKRRRFAAAAFLLITMLAVSMVIYALVTPLETVAPFSLMVVALVASYLISGRYQAMGTVTVLMFGVVMVRFLHTRGSADISPTYHLSMIVVCICFLLILWLQRTEQESAEKNLTEAHSLMQNILDTTVDGIVTIDPTGRVLSFNKAAERLFGYAPHEVIGRNVRMLMPSPYREEHDSYISRYLRTNVGKIIGVGERILTGLRADGSTFPLELAVSQAGQGLHSVFTGLVRDVSARLAHEAELQKRARTDELTGMANRTALFECLQTDWLSAPDGHQGLGLLMIDIDYFKQYNDTYGHPAGDLALKRVGEAIGSCAQKKSDLPARFGGEEFCVVLPGTAPAGVVRVAESIRGAVRALQISHSASATGVLTVSIGCTAVGPGTADTSAEWLERADKALYAAKRNGRDRIEMDSTGS